MYRYPVDKAVTYTSEDFVLYRESPFACWMERLTLENPDHGIAPDQGSEPPSDSLESQIDLAETLRGEGKRVQLIEWQLEEPLRRNETLEAMRHGVDFIVDAQLALGPLSGSANLLMRTSGYSELGNYLYVPCDTGGRTTLHSAFRLCFLADLLHSIQGQLPPQMLIIRGGQEVLPLKTDDHIYHYRAVKKRFMDTQRAFRKHRMPDPAESSHFGRWSECAHDVIKERMLGEPETLSAAEPEIEQAPVQQPLAQALAAGVMASAYDLDTQPEDASAGAATGQHMGTLAEQARQLPQPNEVPTPGHSAYDNDRPTEPGGSGATLESLSFIGSSTVAPRLGTVASAPPPNLRMPEEKAPPAKPPASAATPFSDSLITNEDYDDAG
jgi:hypothetical protein